MEKQLLQYLEEIKQDLKSLDNKLDDYNTRLVVVETNMGFIRTSLVTALAAVGTIFAYVIYKVIDFLMAK